MPSGLSGVLRAIRRRGGGHVDHAGDTRPAMAGEIARDLAARHRHADQRHVAEIERVEHRGEIVRQRVVVVAAARLARASVAAAIVGDAAEAVLDQRGHLVVPHRRREGPGREEDDRTARAPVAVEQVLAVPGHDERAVDPRLARSPAPASPLHSHLPPQPTPLSATPHVVPCPVLLEASRGVGSGGTGKAFNYLGGRRTADAR